MELGKTMVSSPSLESSRRSVLRLYRKAQRNLPWILQQYDFALSKPELDLAKSNVRRMFEQHKDVTDLDVIDILKFHATAEIQEVLDLFKTKAHIKGTILAEPIEDVAARKGVSVFMNDFLENH